VGLSDLVERMAREADPAAIARARTAFEAATGPFAAGETWYEERISAFFDYALASFEHGALARAFAARGDVSDADRAVAVAITRAERSVFRVERTDAGLVCESLFGARYPVVATGTATRWLGGERFDGRLVSLDGGIEAMPGALYHPAETHEAIDHLLREITTRGTGDRTHEAIADALLRMRMRFDRFTSIHAKHVFRYDALDRTEILAASWARPEGRARQ
jgi:hypothetical protein